MFLGSFLWFISVVYFCGLVGLWGGKFPCVLRIFLWFFCVCFLLVFALFLLGNWGKRVLLSGIGLADWLGLDFLVRNAIVVWCSLVPRDESGKQTCGSKLVNQLVNQRSD